MEMTRRAFGKLTGAGIVTLSIGMTGCSVFADIEAWAPTALSAFNGILALLGPIGGTLSILINAIKAALADIPADIKAYQAAPSATTLGKIDEVLSLLLQNFNDFLAQLPLTNPVIGIIIAAAGIILSALTGFINALPPAASNLPLTKAILQRRIMVGSVQVPYTPERMTTLEFKHRWNNAMALSGHHEAEIHIGFLESIHVKR